jgi:hypothetical protein
MGAGYFWSVPGNSSKETSEIRILYTPLDHPRTQETVKRPFSTMIGLPCQISTVVVVVVSLITRRPPQMHSSLVLFTVNERYTLARQEQRKSWGFIYV